jgi:LysR family glycine cleavage system transcriptional activator
MNRHNVPLNGLRVFESAARLLSFTTAARELNITQAAVSQQIRALEKQLDTRLFVRQSRGLALTPTGQDLLVATRPSLDTINDAIERIISGANHHVLTITTLPSFAARWLIPRLDSFQQAQYPFDLHLHTSGHKVDLVSGKIDAAIRLGAKDEEGFVREFLMPDAVCLVGTPAMAKQIGSDITNLYKQPLSMDGTRFSSHVPRDITGHETELFLDSLPLDRSKLNLRMFSASENVVLTALTRLSLCVDDLEQGRLEILLNQCRPLTEGTSFIYPKFREDDTRVQSFRDWLAKEADIFNQRMRQYYPQDSSHAG